MVEIYVVRVEIPKFRNFWFDREIFSALALESVTNTVMLPCCILWSLYAHMLLIVQVVERALIASRS